MRPLAILLLLLLPFSTAALAQDAAAPPAKQRFLIQVTTGQADPTKSALAFLVAKTALEEGHAIDVFLAGDAVLLLKDDVMTSVTGLGTGKLADHYKAIVEKGGRFHLSGNSSKARGLTEADLAGKPAAFATPNVLVRLASQADKVLVY
ncbi:MAG: DsrE family protein [Gammaproteobacteria bacterium]|jgi:predicted peroxiredoxin